MGIEILDGAKKWFIDAASNAGRIELVDAIGSRLAKLRGDTMLATDRLLPFAGVNDGVFRPVRLDRLGNQGMALHAPQFHLNIDGATLHSSVVSALATMANTITTAAGIQMNNAGAVTANAYTILTTRKHFIMPMRGPVLMRLRGRLLKGSTNSFVDFGFGNPATNVASAFGAFFIFGSDGSLRPAYFYNGTPVTGSDFSASIDSPKVYIWDVIVHDDALQFVVQDQATGTIITDQSIKLDTASLRRFSVGSRLPAFVRVANTAVAPATASQFFIGDWYVGLMDAQLNRSWQDTQSGLQMSLTQNPLTGVQLEAYANSAEPASAALSNTVAGYPGVIGGRYQFAAPAGAVTDFCLFSYQVPSGYQAKIYGMAIALKVLGAASATSPTLLEWGINVNAASANLSTAGGVRKSLGNQSIPVATPIGGAVSPLIRTFAVPLTCEGGLFVNVMVRIPVGTATASEILGGTVDFDGYFE